MFAVIIATNSGNQKKAGTPCRAKFTEDLLNYELILQTLNIKPGLTILDAGCGNGYMSRLFSNQVAPFGKVYAVDRDQHFTEILENETHGTNIVAMQEDITKPLPLNELSIDNIYISTVIHIFSKQQMQGFLREVKRLLKPDALLAIVEIEKKETPFGPPLKQRYSAEELKEIIPLVPIDTVQVGEHFYMQIFKKKGK